MTSITEHKVRMLNMAKRMTQKDADFLGHMLNNAEHYSINFGGRSEMMRIFDRFNWIVYLLVDTNRITVEGADKLLDYRAGFERFCIHQYESEFCSNDAQNMA